MDGALFIKHQKVGVGAILEKRNIIMAMRKLENEVDGADDIEALAALRAHQVVCHIGVSHIILEEVPYRWWIGGGCSKVFRYKYVKIRSYV